MFFHRLFSRAGNVDLDVLVYTNTTADGEAAAGGAEAYAANVRSLFSGLTDPERQRAVINIDGEKRVCACMALPLRWYHHVPGVSWALIAQQHRGPLLPPSKATAACDQLALSHASHLPRATLAVACRPLGC